MTPHNVSRCAHQHARRSPWIIPLTLQSRDRGRPGRQPLHGRTSRPRGHPRPGSHALDVTWGPSAAQGCQAAASPPCPGHQALPGEGLWARERRARSPGPHPVQPVGEATSLSRLWHLRPRSMETPGAAFTPGWTRPPEPRPRPQGIRAGGQARLAGAPRAARKVGTVAGGDGDRRDSCWVGALGTWGAPKDTTYQKETRPARPAGCLCRPLASSTLFPIQQDKHTQDGMCVPYRPRVSGRKPAGERRSCRRLLAMPRVPKHDPPAGRPGDGARAPPRPRTGVQPLAQAEPACGVRPGGRGGAGRRVLRRRWVCEPRTQGSRCSWGPHAGRA